MRRRLWRKRRDSLKKTRARSARDELLPNSCRPRASRPTARRTRTARSKTDSHHLLFGKSLNHIYFSLSLSSSGFMWRKVHLWPEISGDITPSPADCGQSNQYKNQTNQQLKFVPKLNDCPSESSVCFTDGIFNLFWVFKLFLFIMSVFNRLFLYKTYLEHVEHKLTDITQTRWRLIREQYMERDRHVDVDNSSTVNDLGERFPPLLS